jgi:hypothetical protein
MRRILTLDGALVREVDRIAPIASKTHPKIPTGLQLEFTLLQAWNLTAYDRILYLDPTTLPLANIDPAFSFGRTELFEFRAPGARSADFQPLPGFTAGVMLLRPSQTLLDLLISKIKFGEKHKFFDTEGLLNWYYSNSY